MSAVRLALCSPAAAPLVPLPHSCRVVLRRGAWKMPVADILCCKPSELAFYPIPKLMIRRVGDHEAHSATRAVRPCSRLESSRCPHQGWFSGRCDEHGSFAYRVLVGCVTPLGPAALLRRDRPRYSVGTGLVWNRARVV